MKSTFHTVLDRTIMVEYKYFFSSMVQKKKSEVQATFFMVATKEREV